MRRPQKRLPKLDSRHSQNAIDRTSRIRKVMRVMPKNSVHTKGKNGNGNWGGYRKGAGAKRKPLKLKRVPVTVKLLPDANRNWATLAKEAKVSKAGVVEWLTLANDARSCHRDLKRKAERFIQSFKGKSLL